jgi:hypothetical protein
MGSAGGALIKQFSARCKSSDSRYLPCCKSFNQHKTTTQDKQDEACTILFDVFFLVTLTHIYIYIYISTYDDFLLKGPYLTTASTASTQLKLTRQLRPLLLALYRSKALR